MVTPYTVTGKVTTPAGGARVATVLIDLIVDPGQGIQGLGFIDANDQEVVASVSRTADPDTGAWTASLYANADIRPANTYYRARYIVDGIEHPSVYFTVTGNGWVGDTLTQPPGNLVDAASSGRQIAYNRVATALSTSSTTIADMAGLALTVPIGTRPVVVEFFASYMTRSTASSSVVLALQDVTAGAEYVRTVAGNGGAGKPVTAHLVAPIDPLPAAGLRTYQMRWNLGEAGGSADVYGNGFFGAPTQMWMRAVEH